MVRLMVPEPPPVIVILQVIEVSARPADFVNLNEAVRVLRVMMSAEDARGWLLRYHVPVRAV